MNYYVGFIQGVQGKCNLCCHRPISLIIQYSPEVRIYKRKQENDQEKRRKFFLIFSVGSVFSIFFLGRYRFFFFSWSLSWSRACFLSFSLVFLIAFLFSCALTFLFFYLFLFYKFSPLTSRLINRPTGRTTIMRGHREVTLSINPRDLNEWKDEEGGRGGGGLGICKGKEGAGAGRGGEESLEES